jgi:hypothetical protein
LCVFAPAAVRALQVAGFDALRLEEGLPEWRRAGLPVAVGDEPGVLGARSIHPRPGQRRRRSP